MPCGRMKAAGISLPLSDTLACLLPHPIPPALPQLEVVPGVMMPTVGYGTAGLAELTADAVFTAIRIGYRLVDSAQVGVCHLCLRCAHSRPHRQRTARRLVCAIFVKSILPQVGVQTWQPGMGACWYTELSAPAAGWWTALRWCTSDRVVLCRLHGDCSWLQAQCMPLPCFAELVWPPAEARAAVFPPCSTAGVRVVSGGSGGVGLARQVGKPVAAIGCWC